VITQCFCGLVLLVHKLRLCIAEFGHVKFIGLFDLDAYTTFCET
jgi:hypothetical protein